LVDRVLEVYRNPAPAPGAAHGWRYTSVATLRTGDVISPLAARHARISITDLLP